ncbi:LADA_0F10990g1_1 [Lachancea dasiensis]|uniref:LADA_0F10990g1_1 n=1 Tax=Lachancea dasiensis TaxID=1072105 RepID=A0A1G4JMJ3_9SACH|nr:LADA_0F10990g1_1 [Lachancea dasiensis]
MTVPRMLVLRSARAIGTWSESSLVVEKKSKFQGRCCGLNSQDEIQHLLANLLTSNKSVSRATHSHIYAWRTGQPILVENSRTICPQKNGHRSRPANRQVRNLKQGFNDCGESGAGQRLLALLERSNIVNVIVVVTRWYGGTPLGSSRFRYISAAAVESLKNAGHLP